MVFANLSAIKPETSEDRSLPGKRTSPTILIAASMATSSRKSSSLAREIRISSASFFLNSSENSMVLRLGWGLGGAGSVTDPL